MPPACALGLCRRWVGWVAVLLGLALSGTLTVAAAAQGSFDPTGAVVREVEISGLRQIEQKLVENVVRARVGEPYDAGVVEADIVRINTLGRFGGVTAAVAPVDGGVRLIYRLDELPILTGVEVRGNQAIDRFTLLSGVLLRAGDAVDRFLIDQARERIRDAYKASGYFVTDVSIDEAALERDRRLVLIVREGPRIRVREIAFAGNTAFPDKALRKQIEAKAWFPVFGQNRVLDREQLQLDASRLQDYYKDRGYLVAQVDRQIDVSPDEKDALVTFVIDEGPRWTLGGVRVESDDGEPLIFTDEQIRLNLALRPGEAFSDRGVRESIASLREMYGRLGYLEMRVVRRSDGRPGVDRLFDGEAGTVDMVVRINEGSPSNVSKVTVRGNTLTRSKVILRELRGLDPGRPFDQGGLDRSRRRLFESPLFRSGSVTVLGAPGDPERDVLVEVAEQNTGEISLGATLSSDDGVLGAISITQRNYDITDLPDSWSELLSNRAFRGAGQTFNLTLSPGSDNSRYSIGLTDPFFLDSDYFLDTSLFLTDRDQFDFEERRSGARLGIGRRFGDVWSAQVRGRVEAVRIREIEPDNPLDVFAVEGNNLITGLSLRVVRNTTDSGLAPSRGSRIVAEIEQVGVLGGDFNYLSATVNLAKFWTVSTDILDRRSTLRFNVDAGYIFDEDEAPTFERFFAGGHSTFRGFRNRGVGPRGIQADTLTLSDEAVGGDFQLLTGLQYEFPLADRILRGVIFTDQGLVSDDLSLNPWRISVGAGIRLAIPILSQAPFALDLAFPLLSDPDDEERVLSFSLDLPFQ